MRSEFRLVGLENSLNAFDVEKVWLSDHREDDKYCAWPYFNILKILHKTLLSD